MILEAYADYLTARSIRYIHTRYSFDVIIPDGTDRDNDPTTDMDLSSSTTISVTISKSGMVTLSTYVGIVNYGIRNARKLTKELESKWPKYKIWPEKYSGYFEIEVEEVFSYSSVNALHKHVEKMAEMAMMGYEIGKDMLGEIFHQ